MATKVPTFASFGKTTNDFFSKEFPGSHKFELTTKAENGLTLSTSGESKFKKDGSPYVLNKLEARYKHEKHGLDFKGTLDTDNLAKAEVSVDNLGLPGFKLVVKPQTGKTQDLNAGFEFQNQHASFATSALFKGGDTLVTAGVVAGVNQFSFGAESSYYVSRGKEDKKPGLESVKGLVNYKTKNLDLTVTAKVAPETDGGPHSVVLGAIYSHKAGSDTTLHTAVDVDTTKSSFEALSFKFGGIHKIDNDITAQAKYGTDGKLTLLVSRQFTPEFKGSLTTEFDVNSLHGNEQKFAFGFTFKA